MSDAAATAASASASAPSAQSAQLLSDLEKALPDSEKGANSLTQLCAAVGLTSDIFRHIVSPLLGHTSAKQQFDVQVQAARVLLPLSRRKAAVAELDAADASAHSLAAGVAALSVRHNSTAVRCDSDSISVILSFLEPSEFVAAIATCASWYGVRLRPRSWPVFFTFRSMEEAAAAVFSADSRQQLLGVRFLRTSICGHNPPISKVQALAGLTERVIALARKAKDSIMQVS